MRRGYHEIYGLAQAPQTPKLHQSMCYGTPSQAKNHTVTTPEIIATSEIKVDLIVKYQPSMGKPFQLNVFHTFFVGYSCLLHVINLAESIQTLLKKKVRPTFSDPVSPSPCLCAKL